MGPGAYLDLDAYKKSPITGCSVGLRVPKGQVTYRFSYAMRHNEANKMTPPPTSCHMRHSQSFDKIDSFLKPVLTPFFSVFSL